MSIRTRQNLNEAVAKINERLQANLSAKEAFEKHLSAEWAKFEQFNDQPHSEEEITLALTPVRAAISFINDEIRMERLEALKEMPYKDAFLDYLRTQCVKGYKIKSSSESVELVSDADVYLDAYDFISTLCSADLNGIIDACCIFVDNVARFALSDAAAVSKNSMHQTYIDLRDRKGWNTPKSKLSKTVLAEQMTEIAKMISCGVAPKMLNADVTFVMNGVIQSKDEADSAGKFVKRDERTVVRFVFRALYTRYNNLAYPFQDTSRASKGALSVKRNKEMSDAPIEKDVVPEAGAVTVTTAEPKTEEPKPATKTGKKSGKKTEKKSEKKAAQTEEDKLVADIMAAAQA